MKPHIRKQREHWVCHCDRYVAVGKTPASTYRRWVQARQGICLLSIDPEGNVTKANGPLMSFNKEAIV